MKHVSLLSAYFFLLSAGVAIADSPDEENAEFYAPNYKLELIFHFTPPPGWRPYYDKCDDRYQPVIERLDATLASEAIEEAKQAIGLRYPDTITCRVWKKSKYHFESVHSVFDTPKIIGAMLRKDGKRVCAVGYRTMKLPNCPKRELIPMQKLEPTKATPKVIRSEHQK